MSSNLKHSIGSVNVTILINSHYEGCVTRPRIEVIVKEAPWTIDVLILLSKLTTPVHLIFIVTFWISMGFLLSLQKRRKTDLELSSKNYRTSEEVFFGKKSRKELFFVSTEFTRSAVVNRVILTNRRNNSLCLNQLKIVIFIVKCQLESGRFFMMNEI